MFGEGRRPGGPEGQEDLKARRTGRIKNTVNPDYLIDNYN
jgi:hypothetical protein